MSFLSKLFGSDDENPEPEPDPEPEERTKTFGIFRADLRYDDGTTETVEYYKYTSKDNGYRFHDEFRTSALPDDIMAKGGEFVPYAVLSRKPESEQVGTATVHYTYDPTKADPLSFTENGREITNIEEDYD